MRRGLYSYRCAIIQLAIGQRTAHPPIDRAAITRRPGSISALNKATGGRHFAPNGGGRRSHAHSNHHASTMLPLRQADLSCCDRTSSSSSRVRAAHVSLRGLRAGQNRFPSKGGIAPRELLRLEMRLSGRVLRSVVGVPVMHSHQRLHVFLPSFMPSSFAMGCRGTLPNSHVKQCAQVLDRPLSRRSRTIGKVGSSTTQWKTF